MIQTCACEMGCCRKQNSDFDNRMEYNETYEEEEYDDEQQFVGKVQQNSQRLYRLPSDIINMKVKANQVKRIRGRYTRN